MNYNSVIYMCITRTFEDPSILFFQLKAIQMFIKSPALFNISILFVHHYRRMAFRKRIKTVKHPVFIRVEWLGLRHIRRKGQGAAQPLTIH